MAGTRYSRRHSSDGAPTQQYTVAHIDGRDDAGSFRVELSFSPRPQTDGDPWLVLGSGTPSFRRTLAAYRSTNDRINNHVPRRVIEQMVAEGHDQTVGGATSIGMAHQHDFDLFCAVERVAPDQLAPRRIFNGLDLDTEVGDVGQYVVAVDAIP